MGPLTLGWLPDWRLGLEPGMATLLPVSVRERLKPTDGTGRVQDARKSD